MTEETTHTLTHTHTHTRAEGIFKIVIVKDYKMSEYVPSTKEKRTC